MTMLKQPRTGAFVDVALIIGVAIVVQAALTPITHRFASLGAAAAVVIVASILVYARGLRWRDFGLRRPSSPVGVLITLGQAGVALVALVAIGAFATIGLSQVLDRPPVIDDRFAGIEGNVPLFAMWLLIGWGVGGFAEELIFRGFLINRIETILKNEAPILKTTAISFLAIIIPGLLFGFVHYWNRGLFGALQIVPVGIGFGVFYLLFRRRLLPLMLAHATVDTLGVTSRFLGADW